MMTIKQPLHIAFWLFAWATSAAGAEISGRASIIDGDTIEIHGDRIRLHGIDAPESRQVCRAESANYRCGQQAAFALADKVEGAVVTCRHTDTDRYGRIVAVCYARGDDIGLWMVSEGWALAYRRYSMDYVDEETAAMLARRGLWRGEFELPWEWRRKH